MALAKYVPERRAIRSPSPYIKATPSFGYPTEGANLVAKRPTVAADLDG